MKITVITGPFLSVPPAPCGAVERIWSDLSREMARRGHDMTIICRAHPELPAECRHEGVNLVPIVPFSSTSSMPVNLAKDFLYGLRVATVLKKSDVVVTNSFFLPMILKSLRRGVGPLHVHVARMPKGQMKHYLRMGAERLAAVSTAVREEIIRECPMAESLTKVFPNPIRTSVFVPPEAPRDYSGDKVIVYTGRIHPEKGLDILVRAYRRLSERTTGLRLRLVGAWKVDDGGGGKDYRDSLIGMGQGLPIEFVDPIYDRMKLREVLHRAHFYCYPSVSERGETFGVAPLEAMGTALPTVVSALSCFKDFIVEGETGLTFQHRGTDADQALAEALWRLIGDPVLAGRIGAAAARRAQDFSIEKTADLYLKDFEQLCSNRRT